MLGAQGLDAADWDESFSIPGESARLDPVAWPASAFGTASAIACNTARAERTCKTMKQRFGRSISFGDLEQAKSRVERPSDWNARLRSESVQVPNLSPLHTAHNDHGAVLHVKGVLSIKSSASLADVARMS